MVETDLGLAYQGVRRRVTVLLDGAGADVEALTVFCCPEWTVKDVVAHLAGTVADIATGRVGGAASDAWTAAQVAERRDRSLADVLVEWTQGAPATEALLGSGAMGRVGRILVADVATHEQDLRGALGRPGGRDSDAAAVALDAFVWGLGARLRNAGAPALRIRFDDGTEQVVGEGEPSATLVTDRFELVRALGGRRSAAQIRDLRWEGDCARHVALLPAFGPAAADVVE